MRLFSAKINTLGAFSKQRISVKIKKKHSKSNNLKKNVD